MATSPRTAKQDDGVKPKSAAIEDIEVQIRTLREEMEKLSRQLSSSGERSIDAARRAAADGVEHLRAQGEAAMEGLRTNAKDFEQQFEATVREKPLTALAVAAGVGFLFALMTRR
jgi:ElaB/YqjD/DUF883 family membrane-anchored ribosome-binding protein